ncbi:hypothetical protein AB7M49_006086 [Bradyrhizobium elkanii]
MPQYSDEELAAMMDIFDRPLTPVEREVAKVRMRLVALGLSKYEPDPLRAIAEAERQKARPQ